MTTTSAPVPPTIVLATLNAKYIHASLGLRCLLANMGELRPLAVLREFTVAASPGDIVDALLRTLADAGDTAPRRRAAAGVQIVAFGVYVWNVEATLVVLRLLRAQRPALRVILGGPEVSHETDGQPIVALADHVITGYGEKSFPALCRALLSGHVPPSKVMVGEPTAPARLALPYAEYSDADIAHRVLYIEASRGCPYHCEFCLSALESGVQSFDLPALLRELETLHRRGARHFKFVDRTFNLKTDTATAILEFFLDRLPSPGETLLLHFEVVPDRLPERLRVAIARFPAGVLQLEVGVQTFNVEVQQRISRRQDNARSEANLRWLLGKSRAHVHADLIFGLPGETLASFANGFDRLHALAPHEIQLGLLKRLRGAPIVRHDDDCAMVYDAAPPYAVLQTGAVDAVTVQRFARLARYWDRIANSGRFAQTLTLLLAAPSPFMAFLAFSDWLWQRNARSNALTPEMLVDALFDYLCAACGVTAETARRALLADYVASAARGCPRALAGWLPKREAPQPRRRGAAQRQQRHLAARSGAD